ARGDLHDGLAVLREDVGEVLVMEVTVPCVPQIPEKVDCSLGDRVNRRAPPEWAVTHELPDGVGGEGQLLELLIWIQVAQLDVAIAMHAYLVAGLQNLMRQLRVPLRRKPAKHEGSGCMVL